MLLLVAGLYASARVFQGVGLTISNNTLLAAILEGAGMHVLSYLNAGSLTLNRSLISDNLAAGEGEIRGAGVYLAMPSVILGDVTVSGNSIHFLVPDYYGVTGIGAGIYAADGCKRGSLTGVVVEENWTNATKSGIDSFYVSGAGIMWDGQSSLKMTRCALRNNRATVIASRNA